MRRIKKHEFEAVSLLTVDNGMLEVTVVPAIGQPDWLIPTSLILSIDDYDDRIWTYLWQGQEVAVYQLIPKGVTPDKIIVLEGNTDVHRIGLQTQGELKQLQVNISQVKDTDVPDQYKTRRVETQEATTEALQVPVMSEETANIAPASQSNTNVSQVNKDNPVTYAGEFQGNELAYLYQTVLIDGITYVIPDLDELAHRLVDLDS